MNKKILKAILLYDVAKDLESFDLNTRSFERNVRTLCLDL